MTPPDRSGRTGPFRRLRTGTIFVVTSILCGLLLAVVALPIVGAAVFTGKSAEGTLGALPAAFDQPAQSQRSEVLDGNGDVLAYFYEENRVFVSLDEIAPVMRQAILSIEDHRFYEHGPLDAVGTVRALVSNMLSGGVAQGGSTLTQQYVKMVQIEEAKKAGDEAGVQAAQESSYGRKIRELRFAISVEKTLSKDQILERYLNIAYFGDGAYGIEVAAEHYFSTTAAKLTLPQAALLAGLVQNPTSYDPVHHRDAALQRRDVVLNRMAELGVIDDTALAKAEGTAYRKKKVTTTINGCQGTEYPFLCDYVYRSLEQTPSLGETVEQRQQTIKRGGLTIKTKIDPKSQDETQQAVSSVVGPTDPLISAMDLVEPGTGLIVAMAQSRPTMGDSSKKGQTYWNYSVSPAMGGAQGFQAGSIFKAFTAAAALEKGIPLSKRYDAAQAMDFSGRTFQTCEGPQQISGSWRVSNSTGVNGVMDMYRAAESSVNTYFVQLALEVGLCDVVAMAEKLGVESSTAAAPISSYADKPSFTLGTVEVSPLSMAEAYATFASGGIHCDPIILTSVTDSTGADLPVPSGNCERVITEDVANAMNSLLGGVMTDGTGRRALTADGRPQAGKTGTIDSNAAVWFVGYTPQVAGAAMISIDNTRAPFLKGKVGSRSGIKGYSVPSTGRALEGSGSGDAGQEIWKPAMEAYLAGSAMRSFNAPPAELVSGRPYDYGNRLPGSPDEQSGPSQPR
ncbi:MAG: transglycosylase domain-containing protein [Microlunatus sp.]|nr:transglycosylase domain-containing protein [Microlunatus sp.]